MHDHEHARQGRTHRPEPPRRTHGATEEESGAGRGGGALRRLYEENTLRRIQEESRRALIRERAARYRMTLTAKLDRFEGTIHNAMSLFGDAVHDRVDNAARFSDKNLGFVQPLAESVVGVVLAEGRSHVVGFLGKHLGERLVRYSTKGIGYAVRGVGGVTNERNLVDAIKQMAQDAAKQLIREAAALVEAIPDEQAASDQELLDATRAAATARAGELDGEAQGSVARGIENQFLEATGAPVTGEAEAARIAVQAFRVYMAERVRLQSTVTGAADASHDALLDEGPGRVFAKAAAQGKTKHISVDENERRRANMLPGGAP